jgi:hypothetical protein
MKDLLSQLLQRYEEINYFYFDEIPWDGNEVIVYCKYQEAKRYAKEKLMLDCLKETCQP